MAELIRGWVGLMSNFRQFDRATGFLLPPSLDEWLPERHLARFVVEVIDGLDLSAMVKSYRGSGSAGYPSSVIVGPVGLRLHDGGVFEPQAGAGDLRFGSVPLHRRERSSRPRHHRNVSASLSQGHRSAVRAGAGVGARDGPAQDGHGGTGRHENPRQ